MASELSQRKVKGYGWHPDLPDQRDLLFAPAPETTKGLPPSVDLSPQMPPVYDQGQLGSCFPAGTRIRMGDGTERPIEEVRLLDSVLTAEGNLRSVQQTMVRLETDGLISIKLWGHAHLRLTAEHPILTARGYVPAREITLDDWAVLPRYMSTSRTELATRELMSKNEMLIRAGVRRMGTLHGRADVAVRVSALPERIRLTTALRSPTGIVPCRGIHGFGQSALDVRCARGRGTLVLETVDLLRDTRRGGLHSASTEQLDQRRRVWHGMGAAVGAPVRHRSRREGAESGARWR